MRQNMNDFMVVRGVNRINSGYGLYFRHSNDFIPMSLFCDLCGALVYLSPIRVIANDSKSWNKENTDKPGFLYGDDSFRLLYRTSDDILDKVAITGAVKAPVFIETELNSADDKWSWEVMEGANTISPFSYLNITGRCMRLVSVNGIKTNTCRACGSSSLSNCHNTPCHAYKSPLLLESFLEDGCQILLDRDSWDGSGLFLIAGYFYPIIDINICRKLKQIGYDNIEFYSGVQIDWS